ncbi:TcpD family membrane protein [Leuconostoc suionicum]|nr:TcpD family membrane protein [Leuconostoc suionicum]MDI6498831.1 TcpD family membrane protein [Leuconostoc suionicum]MDI6500949.1 TcpD family membrane protein [Leuconostoc suionicum]MDI6503043.1 TcpD family membrane protein [Leuconostoc suionicum]MDI6665895.1 TcpD family membrane protein [Leuconostoc suionicum]
MWVTILIGSLIYFFVNGPANTLAQLKIQTVQLIQAMRDFNFVFLFYKQILLFYNK